MSLYLVATLVLAGIAMVGFSFKFLLVLHLIALLVFLLVTGLFLLGGESTKHADDSEK